MLYFKGFIFSTVSLLGQFYSPGTSVNTVLHYYHVKLNFCWTNRVLSGHFFRFGFSEGIFWGLPSATKYFFGSFRDTQLR